MTLLELLVALAVFGLVLVTLNAMLHFTYGVSARRMHGSDAAAQATPALDYLEALIADARLASGAAAFEGRTDRLSLVAPLGSGFADAGGLQSIRLERADGGLRIAWAPFGPAGLSSPGMARALLPDVSELRFRYYGASGAGGAPSWRDEWDGSRALPLLVDVLIGQAGGTRELVVAPRVTGTASSNRR